MAVRPAVPPDDLADRVRRAARPRERMMLGLATPTLLFIFFLFVVPILLFLFRSIDNAEIRNNLPNTIRALNRSTATQIPDEAVFAALIADMRNLHGSSEIAVLARRLNYEISGFRSVIIHTGRLAPEASAPYKQWLIEREPHWNDPAYWGVLRNGSGRFTDFFLLSALDLHRSPSGSIERANPDNAVFLELFLRTFVISFTIMVCCAVIGFPVAAVMAAAKPATANLMLIFVLLPFWSSLLVRATAWILLLQDQGLVNQALIALGAIEHPLKLIFNRVGLTISMTHVLLPYMILPIYSVLRGIPRDRMRAAASLGATPIQAFLRVYLPEALPGLIAGSILVFVISIGYYVAPALVGGASDQMIGYFIAYFTSSTANWGMASALGSLLLVIVALLYFIISKAVGFERLRVR